QLRTVGTPKRYSLTSHESLGNLLKLTTQLLNGHVEWEHASRLPHRLAGLLGSVVLGLAHAAKTRGAAALLGGRRRATLDDALAARPFAAASLHWKAPRLVKTLPYLHA